MRFGEGAAVGKTRSDGAPPSCLSARPAQVSVLTELSFYLFGVQLYQKSSGPHQQLRVSLDLPSSKSSLVKLVIAKKFSLLHLGRCLPIVMFISSCSAASTISVT